MLVLLAAARSGISLGMPFPEPIDVDLTDAALARRVMAASAGTAAKAEAELCRRFEPRIRQYGLRHLRDRDAVHDLVQATLEVTLQKLRARDVNEPDKIASFILGVARLQAHQLRRRAGREAPTEITSETLAIVEAPAEPEALGAERVAECLQGLGERERSVVVLSFYGDLSSSEVAEQLGLSAVNARVIRHRAVERLRECMGLERNEP